MLVSKDKNIRVVHASVMQRFEQTGFGKTMHLFKKNKKWHLSTFQHEFGRLLVNFINYDENRAGGLWRLEPRVAS